MLLKMKTASIKQFRQNMAQFADDVEGGESYIIVRRSKESFKIVPVDTETDETWETVVDFTDNGKSKGASVEDVIAALENMK